MDSLFQRSQPMKSSFFTRRSLCVFFTFKASTMSFSVASNPKFCNIRVNSASTSQRKGMAMVTCTSVQQPQQQEQRIMCDPCEGMGWLLCNFFKGEKTNVKGPNNRIYRRCPTCRAVGYVLCTHCKVYKCITFPDFGDGPKLIRFQTV